MSCLGIARLSVAILCFALILGNVCAVVGVAYSSNAVRIKGIDSPPLDGNVDEQDWVNATFLDVNFTFSNGKSYEAHTFLGHNNTHFLVGVIIFKVGPNPSTVPDYATRPDGFGIYFDVDNDGNLTTPEAGRGLLNFIDIYHDKIFYGSSICKNYFWTPPGEYYNERYWRESRPEIEGEHRWDCVVNAGVYYHEAYEISTRGRGGYYGGLESGDEHFEFCFPLDSNETFSNGLHLETGEARTMGFCLAFYRQGYYLENDTRVPDVYDYWPGDGFTPNVIINASEYAKMTIDLGFSTNDSLNSAILLVAVTITVLVIVLLVLCKSMETLHCLKQGLTIMFRRETRLGSITTLMGQIYEALETSVLTLPRS